MLRGSWKALCLGLMVSVGLSFACSHRDTPTAPVTNDSSPIGMQRQADSTGGSHMLWGMYEITIDPEALQADVVPLRQTEFTCNVTGFLQPKWSPGNLVKVIIDQDKSDPSNGLIHCDVTLQHPFPGVYMYRGFDVRGVVMGHGTIAMDHDSNALYAGPDDLTLLNPDGHTRWWNAEEFGPHGSLFGYIRGRLSPADYIPTATINGFKYFADELGSKEELNLNPDRRGTFSVVPGVNTRRYEIQFPMKSGAPQWRFGYAVDASWDEPDPSGAPSFPTESFPPQANCAEAYMITVTDAGSTAWYEGPAKSGGSLKLDIEVFDWQAPENPDGVAGEIAALWLEGEVVSDPVDLLPIATVLAGSETTSAVFQVGIDDLDLNHGGTNWIWIVAESADPATYEPQIPQPTSPFSWPDAPLAAYLRTTVGIGTAEPQAAPVVTGIDPVEGENDEVIGATITGQHFKSGCQVELRESEGGYVIQGQGESWTDETEVTCTLDLNDAPIGLYDVAVVNPGGMEGELPEGFEVLEATVEIIYVDNSYTGGGKDGSMEHPFNTIHEALDVAEAGNEVWVDDSGVPYTAWPSPVNLVEGASLISVNWDDSDGGDEATILSTIDWSCVVGANEASIEGFKIDGLRCGIECDGTTMDIINCRVVNCYYQDARAIWLHDGSHSHLDGVEVYDVNNNTFPGDAVFYGILVENCDAVGEEKVVIEHTVVHHIFSSGLYEGSWCDPHGIYINQSDGAQIVNTIVYDITGGNYHDVFAIRVDSSDDVKLTNIIVFDVEKTAYYGNGYGVRFYSCLNFDLRNAIISHVRKNWPPQTAYGVAGISSSYSVEYCDVYICSTGLYYGVGPGTGCVSIDPRFVEPYVDFRLDYDSPCIDAGDIDIYDPDGSRSDMGAYGGPGGDW